MVTRTDNTAYRMVALAARLYKERYSEYPERIGLDWFTRMGEYTEHYGEWYTDCIPLKPLTPADYTPDAVVICERVVIKIEPALFDTVEWYPGNIRIKKKPAIGRDEVLCERSGRSVSMTIWFTDNGYHAIIW